MFKKLLITCLIMLPAVAVAQDHYPDNYPGFGSAFRNTPQSWDSLDAWRLKRSQNFWNRTSPFFGDPYYDPMRLSPRSPYRAPYLHPWRGTPFHGDPYYDPYARRLRR